MTLKLVANSLMLLSGLKRKCAFLLFLINLCEHLKKTCLITVLSNESNESNESNSSVAFRCVLTENLFTSLYFHIHFFE